MQHNTCRLTYIFKPMTHFTEQKDCQLELLSIVLKLKNECGVLNWKVVDLNPLTIDSNSTV